MKRILSMVVVFVLCVSVCSCSAKWTDEDITKAHTVEITKYDSEDPNIKVIYTITDAETVKNLCNTFSLLELKDAHVKETIAKSFYIRFIGNGSEIDHITVISGRNTIQDKHGDLYNITDEMDINRHINEVVENAPSEITRDPDENYKVQLKAPAQNMTLGTEDAPPTFAWDVQNGLPQSFVVEIDYMNDGSYISRTATVGVTYLLPEEDWETIKNNAPIVDGVQKIQWRIRIDSVYHTDLDPYYTDWSYFYINPHTSNIGGDFEPGVILLGLKEQYEGDIRELFPELSIAEVEDTNLKWYEQIKDLPDMEQKIENARSKIGTEFIITLTNNTKEAVLAGVSLIEGNPIVDYVTPNDVVEPSCKGDN